jgi:hypothetical protein
MSITDANCPPFSYPVWEQENDFINQTGWVWNPGDCFYMRTTAITSNGAYWVTFTNALLFPVSQTNYYGQTGYSIIENPVKYITQQSGFNYPIVGTNTNNYYSQYGEDYPTYSDWFFDVDSSGFFDPTNDIVILNFLDDFGYDIITGDVVYIPYLLTFNGTTPMYCTFTEQSTVNKIDNNLSTIYNQYGSINTNSLANLVPAMPNASSFPGF